MDEFATAVCILQTIDVQITKDKVVYFPSGKHMQVKEY